MLPPVLMRRNSGPARRLATACQASNASTGQVSACFPRGRPISAPCPAWSVLLRGDAQPQPAGDLGDVLDLQRHQFGAAQRAGEAEQQQGPVAPAAGGIVAGGDQLAQHGQRQRGGLLRPAGRAGAAGPAAVPGCRDARGSRAGR